MNRQLAMKILAVVVFVVVSVIGGWYLACLFSLLPFNMPDFVDGFIRFVLSVTGNNDLANADDMEMLALLLYWIVSTLLVGGLIFAGYRTLRRYQRTAHR
ncbi:hypothetical protein [Paraburkholderia sp. BL21I4N1]|uniref:hypothetical protein n=1 Tax=Paraburkholderia sp. BL21I4N1 TaxID=1938801 RepID=UPI000D410093|nr:hypothetical protein [Paraburkholderia sp. BL21I4N1]PQV54972.1 hypothetical protein B0G83_1011155 [Paraburkholderia sp. BL21I4N1]